MKPKTNPQTKSENFPSYNATPLPKGLLFLPKIDEDRDETDAAAARFT